MDPVHCICRSHRLKIDFQDENFKKYACLKPQGLELVQIMPGGGSNILHMLIDYRENMGKYV